MLKHLRQAFAIVPAAALLVLPCLAASHARHAVGSTHTAAVHTASHTASSRTSRAHVSTSHAAASRAAHGRYAESAERVVPVHHDPVPAMDADRATAIQTALIREGYLSGQPSGVWDSESITAMQKLQDANGWQTKYTPDSRALVKLGLGGAPAPSSQPSAATEAASLVPAAQQ